MVVFADRGATRFAHRPSTLVNLNGLAARNQNTGGQDQKPKQQLDRLGNSGHTTMKQ